MGWGHTHVLSVTASYGDIGVFHILFAYWNFIEPHKQSKQKQLERNVYVAFNLLFNTALISQHCMYHAACLYYLLLTNTYAPLCVYWITQ